ncbi:MAG: class B sortase [Lachnospiraceae bacterium]|nr:class B sortase [Lachnospiraceae bacterium]
MPRYDDYDDYRYDPSLKKKKKKGGFGSFLTTVLLLAAIGVFAFSAWKLVGYYLDYKAGSDEYSNLADRYTVVEDCKDDGDVTELSGDEMIEGYKKGTELLVTIDRNTGEVKEIVPKAEAGQESVAGGAAGAETGNAAGGNAGTGAGNAVGSTATGKTEQKSDKVPGDTAAAQNGEELTISLVVGADLKQVDELENPMTLPIRCLFAGQDEAVENGEVKKLPVLKNPIDFEQLQTLNSEIIGWIRLGALDMSYPITQAADNDYYLHRTFERQDNFAGCIFLNCDNSKFFSDQNSIVYGHNMKDGSMFGKLSKLKDLEVYESNPYFWIFTPDLIYQYRIFGASTVDAVGDRYRVRFTQEGFKEFFEECSTNSVLSGSKLAQTDQIDRVVTLSTCTGDSSTRFVVHGVVEKIYLAEGSPLAQ